MNNLITIDDLIKNAQLRGINFGGSSPKIRIAYLTKLGLIPNATKKKVGGKLVGHYPISALETLDQIEKAKSQGQSYRHIQKPNPSLAPNPAPLAPNFSLLAATLFGGIIIGIFISRIVLFPGFVPQNQTSLLVPIKQSSYKGVIDTENLTRVVQYGDIRIPE